MKCYVHEASKLQNLQSIVCVHESACVHVCACTNVCMSARV